MLQSQEPKLFPVAMNPTQSIGYLSLVSVMDRNAPELPKAVVREERVQVTEASKEGSGVVLLEPVVSLPCSDPEGVHCVKRMGNITVKRMKKKHRKKGHPSFQV